MLERPDAGESEAVHSLLAAGVAEVVVKRGARGATGFTADGATDRAGPAGRRAVDLVGAGDAFVAGYLSGLLDGADVPARLHRAVTTAAFAVATRGDWEGLPTGTNSACSTSPTARPSADRRRLTMTSADSAGTVVVARGDTNSPRAAAGSTAGSCYVDILSGRLFELRDDTGRRPAPTGPARRAVGRRRAGARPAGRLDRRRGHRHRAAHRRRRTGMAGPPRGPHPRPQPDERRRRGPRRPLLGRQHGLRRHPRRGLALPNGPRRHGGTRPRRPDHRQRSGLHRRRHDHVPRRHGRRHHPPLPGRPRLRRPRRPGDLRPSARRPRAAPTE